MIGKNLSHYHITAELGRGGMGIVYRATDTKLDRTVAIKVLPSAALASEDDRARFYREAKAAAQLHHPHIASIFEIDEAVAEGANSDDLRPFIAMEFVEGETLQERIAEGPLKLSEAIRIASQIASGLEVAHEKDIVHRDIKSANVMLTTKGEAKILDFGLAQTAASTKLTRLGSTLGTVAYMSPEQACGEPVDGRSDLWSLGVILYEMVSGRSPFPGDYEQAAVYSILNEDPEPLTAVRTGVPMELEWLVNKCLAKEAGARYQTAADLIVDLNAITVDSALSSRTTARTITGTTSGTMAGTAAANTALQSAVSIQNESVAQREVKTVTRSGRGLVIVGIVGGLLVGYLAATQFSGDPEPASESVMQLKLILPEGQNPFALDLSSDGKSLVYSTFTDENPLRRFDLVAGEIEPILGTEDMIDVEISPDGQWVLITGRYSVSRLSINGGTSLPVTGTYEFADATWSADGKEVYYSRGTGLAAITLSTNEVRILAELDSLRGELELKDPSLLPDGKTLMFMIRGTSSAEIGFVDLDTGERLAQIPGGPEPTYVESGHLLYLAENGVLIAVPFDLDRLEPLSAAVPVREGVYPFGWAVSNSGTLIHGRNALGVEQEKPLVYQSSAEKVDTLDFGNFTHDNMRLSPDGKRLAVQHGLTENTDIWIYELETGSQIQLTGDGRSFSPSWSPDGERILFVTGTSTLVEVSYDGSGPREELYTGREAIDYPSWSPDGKLLTFSTEGNIWLYDEENGARPIRETDEVENLSRFSPDGNYLALTRVVNFVSHIFVQSVDNPNIAWDLSQGPGVDPYWSTEGNMIYYRTGTTVMRRAVSTDPTFRLMNNPEVWMDVGNIVADYAVLPDDSGIIRAVTIHRAQNGNTFLDVVVNFFDYLKEVAPPEGR